MITKYQQMHEKISIISMFQEFHNEWNAGEEICSRKKRNLRTFGMISAGGSSRFLPPLMQQHMAKQMAMISSEIANEPDAIMIIGNFPVKIDSKTDPIKNVQSMANAHTDK